MHLINYSDNNPRSGSKTRGYAKAGFVLATISIIWLIVLTISVLK